MMNYILITLVFIGIGYYEIPDLLSEKQYRGVYVVLGMLVAGMILSYLGATGFVLSNEFWFDLSAAILKALHIKWPF
ncbi:MAG: hypothetical protein ACM3PP_11745 [Candidatus Saccharibacteria bacterium]